MSSGQKKIHISGIFFWLPVAFSVIVLAMEKIMVTIQGRKKALDIQFIRRFITENPSWYRKRLSIELCKRWDWRSPNGRLKDMACRNLLLKLERAGHIVLPPRQRRSTNAFRNRTHTCVPHSTEEINCKLRTVLPLQLERIESSSAAKDLFHCFVACCHYLGYRNTAGENMKYLVRTQDCRPLACLVFAAAVWKTQVRDSYIGWDERIRVKNLALIANNTRFLILPWVNVPHLASHVLSRISRCIKRDWIEKYGHPIYLLETFVNRSRFRGVCYQAANWVLLGLTKGRTRNDRDGTIVVAAKDVYVYPLYKDFRRELCREL